jgi:hypothetical protein
MKSLAYEDIRKELTDFLRVHPVFKDYNFDASGISALVNALAYNDHRLGYFSKMLLDESFVDTAHSFPAMLSHAKRLGYTAAGRKASVIAATVSVVVPNVNYPSSTVTARRGTKFKATNSSSDTRVFTCLDEYELKVSSSTPGGKTFTGLVLLHEGTIRTAEFTVDASVVAPTYDCRDIGLDITTLSVYTQAPGSTSWKSVRQAGSVSDVNPADPVYYTTYDRLGIYKIWFSETYPHATKIKVEYLSTNGASGNGAKVISFVQGGPGTPSDINYYSTVTATSDALSQGGGDGQSLEKLRAAIPQAWRRQYRAVTSDDIKGIITEFYPDTSTVTVWGGEDEPRRRYGKKMVCVVPQTSRVLSMGGRQEIRRLLGVYKIPGDDIIFVDATVQLVDIEVVVRRQASAASDDEIRRDCLIVMDEILGITNNTGITEFSSHALAGAVKNRVAGVEYAYPTATFYTEIDANKAGVAQIDYGNAVHFPVNAPGAIQQLVSEGVVNFTVTANTVVIATPVVPELKALRRVYFEVRSRKVKVIK